MSADVNSGQSPKYPIQLLENGISGKWDFSAKVILQRVKTQRSTVFSISVAAFCFSAVAEAAVLWLPMFSECRVLYRSHNAVEDSFKCQAFGALALSAVALFVLGIVTACIAALHRNRKSVA